MTTILYSYTCTYSAVAVSFLNCSDELTRHFVDTFGPLTLTILKPLLLQLKPILAYFDVTENSGTAENSGTMGETLFKKGFSDILSPDGDVTGYPVSAKVCVVLVYVVYDIDLYYMYTYLH